MESTGNFNDYEIEHLKRSLKYVEHQNKIINRPSSIWFVKRNPNRLIKLIRDQAGNWASTFSPLEKAPISNLIQCGAKLEIDCFHYSLAFLQFPAKKSRAKARIKLE